jgi:putative redox protein
MQSVEIIRVSGDYGFEARDEAGHIVRTDSSPDFGGENYGVRPMQMLLMALGPCSGIDVVSILKKQRQTLDYFGMKISGERAAGELPSLWKTAHIIFEFKGSIDPEKAQKACELSVNKYCSVAETLRLAGCEISWEVKIG